MVRSLAYLILLIPCLACVEPYEFEVDQSQEVLVVDAALTNEIRAHSVKLSFSGALDATEFLPVRGAVVRLQDGTGLLTDFKEVEPGDYQSAPTFGGVVGETYTLHIVLADGSEYSSAAATLPAPLPIGQIYGRYIEVPSTQNEKLVRGIQLFVDTPGQGDTFSNFRYEYREDYEIRSPFPSLFKWNSQLETYSPRDTSVAICYRREDSIDLLIATTSGQAENKLTEYPVRMIDANEPQLNHKYSIVVRQHSITTAAYQYYKDLKENNESSGSFFDKQKGTVPGNITRLGEAALPVLGYFEVAGVSTKTAFFTPDDFRSEGLVTQDPFAKMCNYAQVVDSVSTATLGNSVMGGKNIFQFTFPFPTTAILISAPCSDCRYYGNIEKPKHWP